MTLLLRRINNTNPFCKSESMPGEPRNNETMPATRSTSIWGPEVESGDFIKLPRVFTRLYRFDSRAGKQLQPRHLILLLALAGRRFRNAELEVTWHHLGRDLGIKSDTVRKWAYQLRDMGLLKINRCTPARNPDVIGSRDRRYLGVMLDISPFVELVEEAYRKRKLLPHGDFPDEYPTARPPRDFNPNEIHF